MSQYENARNMDESSNIGGRGKRARDQAQYGTSRGPPPHMPDRLTASGRPRAPAGLQTRDGTIGIAISRPTPVPQWPLTGPIAPPASSESTYYRPTTGRLQPPQRPPRPSVVPSILDASRVQDPVPVFQYTPQNTRASELSTPETLATQSSSPTTFSSMDSIPDFPLPVATSNSPLRRNVNLGAPPSSRRGASSFYSTASFVSPIQEENPRVKSHTTYASSAAIPANFGNMSPGSHIDTDFEEAIMEESILSDDADDSRLVRSASVGKRGKPSLIITKSADKSALMLQRPSPEATRDTPSVGSSSHNDGISSTSTRNAVKDIGVSGLTANSMLNAFESASATDLSTAPQPKPSKPSALHRPPPLDIDAIRTAEARGSLTSLPDLIRRATRLASIMDRGKRPASRLDCLDIPGEIHDRGAEKNGTYELDRRNSGLSDMLAAFPPPASRRSMRRSLASWPLPRHAKVGEESPEPAKPQSRRRCCGLPVWGFLLVLLTVISIVIVAVVVPVKLLVVDKKNNTQPTQTCTTQLPCANGGTSVVSQGSCSCICPKGFAGKDCTTPTTQGCTMITLETEDASKVSNVTIGQAIPKLIFDAQSNFSVPLSAGSIISKFGSAGLSCNAENALVTFKGQESHMLNGPAGDVDIGHDDSPMSVIAADVSAITVTLPRIDAIVTLDTEGGSGQIFQTTLTIGAPSAAAQTGDSNTDPPSSSTTAKTSPTPTGPGSVSTESSGTATVSTPRPTGAFIVTDEMVEFSRVAILFVLQEKTVDDASVAQSSLETFFNNVGSSTTVKQAKNITIGGNNSINLIDLFVDVGAGKVVGGRSN
ncbi:hypothetical protein F4861DRAFT_331448 [Xylaria intraflava]|nr:hypothetical protein F4861DRAFT_331448 [Xylaria intraflava]